MSDGPDGGLRLSGAGATPLDFVHDAPACRVVMAPGALARAAPEVLRHGSRILVITSAAAREHGDAVASDLGPALVARIDSVIQHVPVEQAASAVDLAKDRGVDAVLCLGGGSATGLAKAIALQTGLPIVAVPTTYAGSELTTIWGLTEAGRKTTGRDPVVLPRAVVYDPVLTLTLPAAISAASGLNAVAHAVEGLYAPASSPLIRLMAEEGIRATVSALPRVVDQPDDVVARSEVLYGAWLCGYVLGVSAMGIHHKICHVLGGAFNLPHAPMHAAVLPYAVAYNAAHAPQLAAVTRAFGVGGDAVGAAGTLWDLGRRLGTPAGLAELGLTSQQADEGARIVAAERFDNPRPVTLEGVSALLRAALDGARPGLSSSSAQPSGLRS